MRWLQYYPPLIRGATVVEQQQKMYYGSKLTLFLIMLLVSLLSVGCLPQGEGQPTRINESNQELLANGQTAESSPSGLSGRDNDDSENIQIQPLANGQTKRETRAIWSHAATSSDVDALIAKIDRAHLNVVLLLVYSSGTAYFEPSHTRFINSEERLPNKSKFSGESYPDALSYLLAIRDKRQADENPFNDFEVHAWFTVMQNGAYANNTPTPRPDKTKPYMLHFLHPEFKLKYGCYYTRNNEACINHRYSAVHQPKFRAYMTDLITGLVEDYKVDGVHLDYIRAMGICYNAEPLDYPGTEFDYLGCQADYKAWTKATYGRAYNLWQDTDGYGELRDNGSGRIASWQEQAVGTLVKNIHDEAKAVKPGLIISAAVGMTSPEDRRESVQGQAAWEWLDQGWIDAAFVMAYYVDTQAVVEKNQEFMNAVQNTQRRSQVFPGLATFDIDNREDQWSYLVVEQINATTRGQWSDQPLNPPAKGVAFFVDKWTSEAAIDILGKEPFREPALPWWGDVAGVDR